MSSCSIELMDPLLPSWILPGPFVQAADPAGGGALVWISNNHVPSTASFRVPFVLGDRITDLVFEAFGNGSNSGLQNIEVIYQPDGATGQILAVATTSVARLSGARSASPASGQPFYPE